MSADLDWDEEYHPESIRLDGWDYRQSAWYFLTICTQDRRPYFGAVRNGIVGLSRAGCIAAQEWRRTPEVRPYVRLDAWIVMPNHVHGILGITTESPGHNAAKSDPSKSLGNNDVETSRRDVSTGANEREPKDKPQLRAHSVGAIIGQYKSVCTKRIRAECRPDFGWQARFYDRILRNRQEFEAARRYVNQNSAKWTEDRHFQSS
jgi:REP element-mobilizing transposase RayT